ncbi:MAG: hypothetical protein ACYCW6_04190 [Candidatus Xenobia bacterium]
MRLWDTRRGALLQTLEGARDPLAVSVSARGYVAAAGTREHALCWYLDWDLELPPSDTWEPAADVYLAALVGACPDASQLDPAWLREELGLVGYGWLTPSQIETHLPRLLA